MRFGTWKAIRNAPGTPLELYDLSSDGGEQTDVASSHPEVLSRVESYLRTARTESSAWPLEGI